MKINVAIDGPTAAGKGTIAKKLADQLGYQYLDTGIMYRCVAYLTLKNGFSFDQEGEITQIAQQMKLEFNESGAITLNEENVTDKIREPQIALASSKVSTILSVREELVKQQQSIAKSKGIVLDGRDIGTVVLPDAEVKIFLTADPIVRAQRRFLENKSRGIESDFEKLKQEIEERDFRDLNREHSPLKKATDAIEVDTTALTIEEVVQVIVEIIKKKT